MKRSFRLILALVAVFAISASPAFASVYNPPKRVVSPLHMIKKIVKPATATHAAVTYTIDSQRYANSTGFTITGVGGQVLVSGTLGFQATAYWAHGNPVSGTQKASWGGPSATYATNPRPGNDAISANYDGGVTLFGFNVQPASASITESWTYQLAPANILGCGGIVTLYASMQVNQNGSVVGRRWHTAPGCMGAPGWDANKP